MSLLKRLRNLWRLSAFEPDMIGAQPQGTKIVKGLVSRPQEKARIILKKVDPIEELIKNNE